MKNILDIIADLNANYTEENEKHFEEHALNEEFYYIVSIVFDIEDETFVPVFTKESYAKVYETPKNKIYRKKLADIPNPNHHDFLLNPTTDRFIINYDLLDDGSFEILGADTRSLLTMMTLREHFETYPVDKAYLATIKTKTSEQSVLIIEGIGSNQDDIKQWVEILLQENPNLELYDIFTNNEKFGKQIIQQVSPFYTKKSRS